VRLDQDQRGDRGHGRRHAANSGALAASLRPERLQGLLDEPPPRAPRKITDVEVERVIALTLERTPRDATHWSTRAMAKRSGLSQTAVSRIWRAFGLQPHRSRTFKLSKDPLFIDKVRDIVGLYPDPPDKALVLCVDEQSQIQALDRTQPVLPMRPGQVKRRAHGYTRHGTTRLFAALDAKKASASFHQRHRAREFRRFLVRRRRDFPLAHPLGPYPPPRPFLVTFCGSPTGW
jgi:transcriptional regulator with XRE-family HTH domain